MFPLHKYAVAVSLSLLCIHFCRCMHVCVAHLCARHFVLKVIAIVNAIVHKSMHNFSIYSISFHSGCASVVIPFDSSHL